MTSTRRSRTKTCAGPTREEILKGIMQYNWPIDDMENYWNNENDS